MVVNKTEECFEYEEKSINLTAEVMALKQTNEEYKKLVQGKNSEIDIFRDDQEVNLEYDFIENDGVLQVKA
jgi:hypothetical protein